MMVDNLTYWEVSALDQYLPANTFESFLLKNNHNEK